MSEPERRYSSTPSLRLARILRDARERCGMRQEDVARAVGIGTSSYRSLENGAARGPSLYTVLDLLDLLGVDPSELAGLSAQAAASATTRAALG